MSNLDNIKIKKLIHSIGLNNNLTDNEIKAIVESQFEFTYNKIINIDIDKLPDKDLKTNFIYKYIGKIHTSEDIVKKYNKTKDYIK